MLPPVPLSQLSDDDILQAIRAKRLKRVAVREKPATKVAARSKKLEDPRITALFEQLNSMMENGNAKS